MRLSFVGEFSALLFFGPIAMTLVATIGALGARILPILQARSALGE